MTLVRAARGRRASRTAYPGAPKPPNNPAHPLNNAFGIMTAQRNLVVRGSPIVANPACERTAECAAAQSRDDAWRSSAAAARYSCVCCMLSSMDCDTPVSSAMIDETSSSRLCRDCAGYIKRQPRGGRGSRGTYRGAKVRTDPS